MLRRLLPLSVLPAKAKRKFYADILKREFMTASVYGRPMILPIRKKGIGITLAIFGERELDQLEIMKAILRPGATVLDIGANIGYYAVIEAALIGKEGRIYAYEPDSGVVDILLRNIALNGVSDIINVSQEVVSDSDGVATFHIAEHSNLSAMHISRGVESKALVERNINNRKYLKTIKVNKRGVCDILLNAQRPIDLIRMDIEGHEVEILASILRGLDQGIINERAPKYVLYEPHSWEYTGNPNVMYETLQALSQHGYRITRLGTRDETRSPIAALGYKADRRVKEKRGMMRGIYRDIPQDEAIRLASSIDGVTTVLLERVETVT